MGARGRFLIVSRASPTVKAVIDAFVVFESSVVSAFEGAFDTFYRLRGNHLIQLRVMEKYRLSYVSGKLQRILDTSAVVTYRGVDSTCSCCM